jgi:hypothetical protein
MQRMLITGCIVLAMAGTALADPGVPDTVKLECDGLIVGQSRPIQLSIANDEEVLAFSVGFEWQPAESGWPHATFDSITWIGRMADPEVLDTRMTNAVSYNEAPPDTIGFAAFGFANLVALPTGNGPVAQLWFTAAGPGGLSIDSSFFLPNNPFKMVGKSDFGRQEDILPMFTAPAVVPVSTTAAPELVVDDNDPVVESGTAVTIQVLSVGAEPDELTLSAFSAWEDEAQSPAAQPSFDSVTGMLSWTPSLADIGAWRATFEACINDPNEGPQCDTVRARIQVAADPDYMLCFNYATTDAQLYPLGMITANFDSDPQPEIVTGGILPVGSGSARCYHWSGGDEFTSSGIGDQDHFAPRGLEVGYLDTDEHLDIVMAQAHVNGKVVSLLGRGDGLFNSATGDAICGPTRSAATGNFIDDASLDYVTVYGHEIKVFRGLGDGSFETANTVIISERIMSVNSADFNGDGLDDLAVGTESGLSIYLGDGTGEFTCVESHSQFYGSADVEITNQGSDFNGDDLFDLCLATPSRGGTHSRIVVYFGQGDGHFTQQPVRQVAGHILANTAGDFNGDGLLDIAAINGSRDEVMILFGDGLGGFPYELRRRFEGATGRLISATDMDLDGDIDIVVGGSNSPTAGDLKILENLTDPGVFTTCEVTIDGFDNATLKLTSASGLEVKETGASMPAATYYLRDANGNEKLDDRIEIALVEDGPYQLEVLPRYKGTPYSVEYTINGERFRLAHHARADARGYRLHLGDYSPIVPRPGSFVYDPLVELRWESTGPDRVEAFVERSSEGTVVDTTVVGGSLQVDLSGLAVEVGDTITVEWFVTPEGTYSTSVVSNFNYIYRSPTDADDRDQPVPHRYALNGNYPNPFNPRTTIRYSLASRSAVRLDIFNILGQSVKTLVDEVQSAGEHSVVWEGNHESGAAAAAGVYFYRLQAGDYRTTRKMILLK